MTLLVLFITVTYSYGEENSKIGTFPKKTIIIGTHAIHFDALNEKLIDMAEKSKDESGQQKVYYKSELANGDWFDITNSEGINSIINDTNNVVPKSIIKELPLTHWTNEKGDTIELNSGKSVSVNNMTSYKDPNNMMPELKALKNERDMYKSKYEETEESEDRKIYKNLDSLFEIIEGGDLDKYEALLASYDEFIKFLKEKKQANDNIISIANKNKENIKAKHDILCLEKEKNKILAEAQSYGEENRSLAEKLYAAVSNLESKAASIEIRTYNESTSLGKLESVYSVNLKSSVEGKNFEKAYDSLISLYYINNIMEGLVLDKAGELLILSKAKDENNKNIQMLVSNGDPEIYIQSKNNKESTLVLKNLIEKNGKKLTEQLQEKLDIKDYTLLRMESDEEKIGLLTSMKDKLIYFKEITPVASDIHDTYIDILDKFINELAQELAKLKLNTNEEYLEKKSELDDINGDIEYLNEAYLDAIEKGDMTVAESIEGQLEELSSKKEKLQEENLNNYLETKKKLDDAVANGDTKLADDLREELLESQMMLNPKDGAFVELIDENKNKIVASLNSGDLNGIEEKMNNLKDLLMNAGRGIVNSDTILEELSKEYEKEYTKAVDSGDIALAKKFADIKHLFKDISDNDTNQIYAFLDKILELDKYRKLVNDTIKLEEELNELEAEINTGLKNKKTIELEKKLDKYIQALNNYDIKQKQKIMTNILLIDLFKKSKQIEKKNGNITDEAYTNYLETAEAIKSDFIIDMLEIENNKYSEDYLNKIEKTSLSSNKLETYKVIPVDKFIMTDFNVPFQYPVLIKNDGVYLIPLRALYETFGGEVSWNKDERKAIVNNNDKKYVFKVGKKEVEINDRIIELSSAIELVQGKTYIPVEFIENVYNGNTYSHFDDNTFIIYGELVEEIIDEAINKIYKLSN